MEKLSENILNFAIKNECIKSSQFVEYKYILTLLLNIIVTDITMLIIGFAMHMVWECIVFWLMYKALRKYCGGFHFSTSLKCYLATCFMCPIVLLLIQFIPNSFLLLLVVITALSAVLLFTLAPVEATNKPLDEKERIIFGRVARILVSVVSIVYAVALLFNWYYFSKIVSLSTISVTIFVMIGLIHNAKLRQNINKY